VRIWVDFTNTAHVQVLRPLVELLEERGHDVEMTARPLSQTVAMLDRWGRQAEVIGHHGGAGRLSKGRAAVSRVRELRRWAKGRGLDYGLAHGSTDLPVVCRLLRLKNTTMFDYEWAAAQHSVNCRLATRVLVPDAIPAERLGRYGARSPKLVQYPGLKEEYFLAEFEPDPSVLEQAGADPAKVVCVVRTAPSYALYLGGSENPLLPRLLEHISQADGAQAVVIARTPEQADAIDSLGFPNVVVPRETVDGRSLVALADLLVSAGGTMNREAAVLGTPVWSIFEGKPGAVDEQLIGEGRLRMLVDPADLVIQKKADPEAWRNRVRRDPAELLRLAVPV
jgi:predicted glycosyltransferase